MSDYKKLSSSPCENIIGDTVSSVGEYPSTWIESNFVLNQTTNNDLYSITGLVQNTIGTLTHSTTSVQGISAITYGNGLYVYAGYVGTIASSTDAITWTDQTSGTGENIFVLEYGNGLYLAAGSGGVLLTSTDAITWDARTSGTVTTIRSLLYGNGLYVYGANGGVLATSTDAITWTARTSGTATAIIALTYGNGLYVYGGNNGVLATSTDAITWTARTSGTYSIIHTVVYGNGIYLYGDNEGTLATSTDAITWNRVSCLPTQSIIHMIFTGNQFVYATYGGNQQLIRTSTNGKYWNIKNINLFFSAITGLTYGNDKIVIAGDPANTIASGSVYSYDPATQFVTPNATSLIQGITTTNYYKAD